MIQGAKVKIARARRRIYRTIPSLRRVRQRSASAEAGGIKPENMIWIFGAARTGSTWLGTMMAALDGHTWWHEPMVGHLFGHIYQERAGRRHDDEHFILGGEKDLWLGPVRTFVLDSAKARFPEAAEKEGYLVIKEPTAHMVRRCSRMPCPRAGLSSSSGTRGTWWPPGWSWPRRAA